MRPRRPAGAVSLVLGGDRDRLEVVVPWARVTFFEYPERELCVALRRHDPAALFALHPEFAPFRCPTCESVCCDDHWLRVEVEDEGFHDETRGSCPRGHDRMLLD